MTRHHLIAPVLVSILAACGSIDSQDMASPPSPDRAPPDMMQPDDPGKAVEPGIDRPGRDFRDLALPAPRAELCQAECARDARCDAYSYFAPGALGPGARCLLKSDVPRAVPNSSVTSGVRTAVEWKMDRPGQDLRSFDLPETRPELCQTECAKDADCKAYTYVTPGPQGPNARCWLKSGVPAAVPNTTTISGVKRGLEQGIDRPGQDLRDFDLVEARPELCQAACAKESQCQSYTYVQPGAQGPSARCWLKSGIPAAVVNTATVSGLKGLDFF